MEVSKNAYYHMFLGVGRISNLEKRVLGMLGQGVSKKNNRKILIFEKFPSHLKKPVLNCTRMDSRGANGPLRVRSVKVGHVHGIM